MENELQNEVVETKQEEGTGEPEVVVEDKDATIAALRQHIVELSGMASTGGQQQQQVVHTPQPQQQPQQAALYDPNTIPEYLNDGDFKQLFESGDGKKVLNRALHQATASGVNTAITSVLSQIPAIVANTIAKGEEAKETFDALFKQNPDLAPHRQAVISEATRLSQINPALPISELARQAEALTRQRLLLPKAVGRVPAGGKPVPGVPTRQRGTAPVGSGGKREDIRQQIEAMKRV